MSASISSCYLVATHTPITVLGTSTVVLAANKARRYLLLINDSDTVIYIKLGATAVVNQGIRLNANGGSYEMTAGAGNVYEGAINAISAIATKILLVTEGA